MESVCNRGIEIGYKLRKLRMDKGYSQEYLAEVLGVSQKTYSNMENNKTSISIETLRKIAEEYGVDMLEILKNDRITVQNNTSKENSTFQGGIIYNHMADELMQQMKERIEDLKKLLAEKEHRITELEEILGKS